MAIVQQNSGTFTGTSFTASLPGASSSSNTVVVVVAGNTTVTTPGSWTLRTSQVNFMGHYLYDRAGVSITSQAFSNSAGQGTWWMFEVGAYVTSSSANASTGASTYNTPTLTPSAGDRELLASIGSVASPPAVRTITSWSNSFIEQIDVCQASADYPMQGGAILAEQAANGSTGYSTAIDYSATSPGRSAIIAAYGVAAGGGAPDLPPMLIMPPLRRS